MNQRTQSQAWVMVSAIAIGIAVIGVALRVPAVLQTVFAPRLGSDPTVDTIDSYVASHDANVERYAARFDGRSLFFKPRRPPREVEPIKMVENEPRPTDPGPTPPPSSYSGPTIIGVVGDTVWFKDDIKIRLGEEGHGVTVISLEDVPWEVRLGHRGGEYDVSVFSGSVTEGLTPDPLPASSFPGVATAGTTGSVRQ